MTFERAILYVTKDKMSVLPEDGASKASLTSHYTCIHT